MVSLGMDTIKVTLCNGEEVEREFVGLTVERVCQYLRKVEQTPCGLFVKVNGNLVAAFSQRVIEKGDEIEIM